MSSINISISNDTNNTEQKKRKDKINSSTLIEHSVHTYKGHSIIVGNFFWKSVMYEKLRSYSLWGSARDSEDKLEMNKQAYDVHKCFLLIIPEVILHGDKNKMKLYQWAFFSFISMWKIFLSVWAVSFWTKYLSPGYTRCMQYDFIWKNCFCLHRVAGLLILRDFHTILKLTVLQTQIEKNSAALSVSNGSILFIKRPHHT